ncbi:hypothetical protein L226DRAFT_224356 [Lentinus tigrinus ALCF2SS1-7]|uniref:Peptidase S8/S53 domain-containing protein n=1 Tax=Lentinus tigrinus ALCF2SS1-6 TaxID=1328759 RepID=A0A5C2RUS5_9APHY|nr:hypothetical protein L227DRAFT_304364 [Lentinus tigrinus ALCF2SS1-6]RPD70701.1 hypothetical protein L226DRAFT_224356 [Lentinus tigrinus ALCF2SS1-7]
MQARSASLTSRISYCPRKRPRWSSVPAMASTKMVSRSTFPSQSFSATSAQLGSRGTTVLFCSGDNGVYSFPSNSTCDATTFGPTFPRGCPFLTSVGGTQGVTPEVAASFSSGGLLEHLRVSNVSRRRCGRASLRCRTM